MSQSLIVDLSISADEYLSHYKGQARYVICHSRDGRRVRFPSSVLQRFVLRDGIRGSFCIEFDNNNRLVSFRRLE